MGKTRLSLFYLAGYLSIGGFCLLVFPQTAVGLLLSNGDYSNVMLRMVGVFMLARNSHQPTAASAHLPESTALRSGKGLGRL